MALNGEDLNNGVNEEKTPRNEQQIAKDQVNITSPKSGAGQLPEAIRPPVKEETPEEQLSEVKREVKREMNDFERSTIKWARVAVLMSALAAVFVCLQWYEMRAGSADTHALAVAAGNQAYAACVNAQISRKALIEVQSSEQDSRNATRAASSQAIVAAESAAPVISINGATAPTFNNNILVPIDIQNNGKTDARNIRAKARVVFIARFANPDFVYNLHRGVDLAVSVLPAGVGTTNTGNPITVAVFSGNDVEYMVKDGDIAAYQSGEKDVILYGFVSYQDIFTVPHRNYFCKAYQVFKAGLLENNGHAKCSDYNKVDTNGPVSIGSPGTPAPSIVPDIECTPPTPEPPPKKKWFLPN